MTRFSNKRSRWHICSNIEKKIENIAKKAEKEIENRAKKNREEENREYSEENREEENRGKQFKPRRGSTYVVVIARNTRALYMKTHKIITMGEVSEYKVFRCFAQGHRGILSKHHGAKSLLFCVWDCRNCSAICLRKRGGGKSQSLK